MTKVEVKRLEDGPNGNTCSIYALMLTVEIPGAPPMSRRMGHFEEGFETFAREFAEWCTKRLSMTGVEE